MSKRRRIDFSLVELIIILTAIVSFISLIVPVLQRGGQQARSVLCSSNQYMLGARLNMVASSNDNVLPAFEDGWVAKLAAIDDTHVESTEPPSGQFACPSQRFTSGLFQVAPSQYWRGTYYGINQHAMSKRVSATGQPLPRWGQAGVRMIKDPSSKLAIADAAGGNYFDDATADPTVAGISRHGGGYADSLPPGPASPLPALRHINRTANMVFVDGHAEVRSRWPEFMLGVGTGGYDFWHAEHRYPGCGY